MLSCMMDDRSCFLCKLFFLVFSKKTRERELDEIKWCDVWSIFIDGEKGSKVNFIQKLYQLMIFENNILSRIFVSLYFKHPEFWRLCGRRKQNDSSSLLELCENAHGTNLSTLINGIEWSQIMFKKVKKNISEVNVQRCKCANVHTTRH